jgi:hypothetical protein
VAQLTVIILLCAPTRVQNRPDRRGGAPTHWRGNALTPERFTRIIKPFFGAPAEDNPVCDRFFPVRGEK